MLEELEESIDMSRRAEEMLAESDPHKQIRLFVTAHCALFATGADVLRAAIQAIGTPEVAALAVRGNASRRRGIDELTRRWHEAGALRPGLTTKDAAERMWLLTAVESYLTAVDRLGWSSDHYQEWLGDLLDTEILTQRT